MSSQYRTDPGHNQFVPELTALADLFCSEGVKSYLEIGSKYGASLWGIGSRLPKGSVVVSVEMPGASKHWKHSEGSLHACVAELRQIGQRAHLILGDSTDDTIVLEATKFAPFDALLIDANHTLPYVTQDWQNYGPLARIVAFHDVAWSRPLDWNPKYPRMGVETLWQELKAQYRHKEIKLDPTGRDNGFGVIWRS